MRATIRADIKGMDSAIKSIPKVKSLYRFFGITAEQLADVAVDKMKEVILRDGRKRPPNKPSTMTRSNLANAWRNTIKISKDGRRYWVGIGDQAQLDAEAPYWAIINYGGVHPSKGMFVPGFFENDRGQALRASGVGSMVLEAFGTGQRFVYGQKTYGMRPKKPIVGIHYIEAGINELIDKWQKLTQYMSEALARGEEDIPTALLPVITSETTKHRIPVTKIEKLQKERQIAAGLYVGTSKWRYSRKYKSSQHIRRGKGGVRERPSRAIYGPHRKPGPRPGKANKKFVTNIVDRSKYKYNLGRMIRETEKYRRPGDTPKLTGF